MDFRIFDILVVIAQQLQSTDVDVKTEGFDSLLEGIIANLETQGYSFDEINSAIDWFLDNEIGRPHLLELSNIQQPVTSFRLLDSVERIHISPESYGFLIKIHQLGIIDNTQLEQIIERTVTFENQVDLALIKAITISIIFDRDIEDYLPNDNWAGFVV